jgi:integrase
VQYSSANPAKWCRLCRARRKRHAYAIRLAEAGVPLEIVSEMLGHHSVDFTKKNYAKYAPTWAGKVVLAALDCGKSESGKIVATGQKKRNK